MNRHTSTKRLYRKGSVSLFYLSAVLLSPLCVLAQDKPEEDVFELSPFEVSTTDTGSYIVEDTLAGNRLRSETKDLGASITIISQDFMEDLGITSYDEVMQFMPSTEKEETYSTDVNFNSSFLTRGYRVRGLKTQNLTRNFFRIGAEWGMAFDPYNGSRTTLSAGANSILYGVANPAGVINSQTRQPVLRRTFQTFRHKTDNYGTMRFEYDGNINIVTDKFGIRVALLDENAELWQEPQWKDQERQYIAAKWRLTKNTTINANFENSHQERNTPASIYYIDQADSWRDEGMPLVPVTGTSSPAGTDGVRSYGGGNHFNLTLGSVDPNVPVLQKWRHRAISDYNVYTVDGYNGISNPDLYDGSVNLQGDLRINENSGQVGDISIEHKFTDNLYAQIAWNGYDYAHDVYFAGYTNLRADASENLPGSGANPDAGRYYISANNTRRTEYEFKGSTIRGTISYELDLSDKSRWLGRHQFAAMYEDSTSITYKNVQFLVDSSENRPNANVRSALNRVRPIYYVDLDRGITPLPGQPTDPRDFSAYLAEQGAEGVTWESTIVGGNQEVKSEAALLAVQSHWLNDRLVTTWGIRNDKQDIDDVRSSDWPLSPRGYFYEWSELPVSRTPNEALSDISEDTYSIGVVYHLIRDAGPVDLLSLTYNTSNNFSPTGTALDFQKGNIASQTGETEDIGIKAQLFDGKLSFRLAYYEGGQINSRLNGTSALTSRMDRIWDAIGDNVDESLRDNGYFQTIQDTQDLTVDGYEMVLHYTPTRNFKVRATLSYNNASVTNVAPSAVRLMNEEFSEIRSLYGDVPMDDTSNQTVNDILDDAVEVIEDWQVQEGGAPNELRKWRGSVVGTYNFRDGPLKGFTIGGTINYSSASTIGYAEDDLGRPNPDVRYEGSSTTDYGLNLSYKKKFSKVDWTIQLNIRNLFDDTDPVPVRAAEAVNTNDEPLIYRWRAVPPRSFILTNTFRF